MRLARATARSPRVGGFGVAALLMLAAFFRLPPGTSAQEKTLRAPDAGPTVVEVTVTPAQSEWTAWLSWRQSAARFHVEQLGLCLGGYLDLLVVASLSPSDSLDADRPLALGPADSFLAEGEGDVERDPVVLSIKAHIEQDIEGTGNALDAWKTIARKGYDSFLAAYLGIKGILLARTLPPGAFWSRPSKVKVSKVHVLLPGLGEISSLRLFCYSQSQLARAQQALVAWAQRLMDDFETRRNYADVTSEGIFTAFWKSYEAAGLPDELSSIRPKVYLLSAVRAHYPQVDAPEDCAPCRDIARKINDLQRQLQDPDTLSKGARNDGAGGMSPSFEAYDKLIDAYRSCLKRHACVRTEERFTRTLDEAEPETGPLREKRAQASAADATESRPVAALTRLPERFVTGSGRNALPKLDDRCADEAMRRLVAERCTGGEETDLELARVSLARQLNALAGVYDESRGSADKRRYIVRRWRKDYARYRKLVARIAATRNRNQACIRDAVVAAQKQCAAERQKEKAARDLKIAALSRNGRHVYAIVENRGRTALKDVALELMFLSGNRPLARSTHVYALGGPRRIAIPAGARVPVHFLMDKPLPEDGTLRYGMRWKARSADRWFPTPSVEKLRIRYSWGYGVYITVLFDLHNTGNGPAQSGICLVGLLDPQEHVLAAGDFHCDSKLAPGERRSFSTTLTTKLLDALDRDGDMDALKKRALALKPVVFVAPDAMD